MTIYAVLREAADECQSEAVKEADEAVRLYSTGAASYADAHNMRGATLIRRAHAIEQALAELPREVAEREVE